MTTKRTSTQHDNTNNNEAPLALYQSLVYGNDQLLKKARKSIDKTNDIKPLNITSSSKLILVTGYIRYNYKGCSTISDDIILLTYYFYDVKLQRSYLSPYYYRAVFISRPFGLALCEKLHTKYMCTVLPNSPNGKLGLRSGSRVIGYNNYVFEEENIKTLNEQFTDTKNKVFAVNKDIKSHMFSDGCLPLTLYLKYDPIALLQHIDESISDDVPGNCNFFDKLHQDTLRWAIHGKVECYRIIDINGCDVLSTLPIQSDVIQNSIHAQINDLKEMNGDIWNDIICKCVSYDDIYFKIGHIECNEIVKTYGVAGCYLYCVRPIQGWIQFVDTQNGANIVQKCEDYQELEVIDGSSLEIDSNKMCIESKYHFKIAVLTKYLRQCKLCDDMTQNIADDEPDDFDGYYDLMEILNAIESRENMQCFKIMYFINSYTMMFSSDFKKSQQDHIKKLINIVMQNKNVELLIVRIQNNVYGDYDAKLPVIINGIELRGYITGRTNYKTLKGFDLLDQMTSFRFGILLLGPNNQIFIRPNEVINDSIFRKIKYLIQGRRLSRITNLLNSSNRSLPFINRTLSAESI